MRKSLLHPIFILLVLFGFSLWNSYHIQKNAAYWSKTLQQAVSYVQSENWTSAQKALHQSYEDWSHAQTYLHIVLEHDAIDDADAMFRRVFAFAETHDTQELQAELADLIDQLNLLAEMERLSLKNVL
jgi:hypothetical protein